MTPLGRQFPFSISPSQVIGCLSSLGSPEGTHWLYQAGVNQVSPWQTEQRLWDISFSPELFRAMQNHSSLTHLSLFFPSLKAKEILSP